MSISKFTVECSSLNCARCSAVVADVTHDFIREAPAWLCSWQFCKVRWSSPSIFGTFDVFTCSLIVDDTFGLTFT